MNAGYRSALVVPLFKDNEVVGIITLGRKQMQPFTDKQISLFRDFAAQATIALESTRRERRYREMQMELAHANRVVTMGQLTASITHEVHYSRVVAVMARGCDMLLRVVPEEGQDVLPEELNAVGEGAALTDIAFEPVSSNRSLRCWEKPAPIPEWQTPGDPRAKIRIEDLLHMSSGLRIRAPQDPDYDPSGSYPDHLYLYTGGINSYHYAATRPQQWPPNTVGRYRNTDPVLISYLIRLAVEKSSEEYLSFPQRALFDKLGIRTMRIETDPFGNFLGQGYEVGCGRDWARLGNLYLQDGVWNGERILPPGYVKFVSTPAPAWVADKLPIYGGFFWINGLGQYPVPRDSYYMAGAGGQTT